MNRQQEMVSLIKSRLAAVANKQRELHRRLIKLQRRSRKLSDRLSGDSYVHA